MTFRVPQLLLLALLVPVALIFFIARARRRLRIARRFVSERSPGVANPLRRLRPWLAALALLGCVIALAGPEAGVRVVPNGKRGTDPVTVICDSLITEAR